MKQVMFVGAAMAVLSAAYVFSTVSLPSLPDWPDVPDVPTEWSSTLDPYMEKQGWALNDTRETISKNGVSLWYHDRYCMRFCNLDNYLGPRELETTLSTKFFQDLKNAQNQYVADFAKSVDMTVPSPDASKDESK